LLVVKKTLHPFWVDFFWEIKALGLEDYTTLKQNP